MRTLERAHSPLPRLTSRRHIDLGRTSSAVCRTHRSPRPCRPRRSA
ncbi:putative leader peptide [Streptomyces sp. NPDC003717]